MKRDRQRGLPILTFPPGEEALHHGVPLYFAASSEVRPR